jgi:hypothetical protein
MVISTEGILENIDVSNAVTKQTVSCGIDKQRTVSNIWFGLKVLDHVVVTG